MAITIKEIAALLDEVEFGYKIHEDGDMIVSGGGSKENRLAYFIMTREDGDIFEMEGRLLTDDREDQIKAKEHKHLAVLLSYLLKRNYDTKFGTWEFNPETGLIRVMVEIPLEDNTLTAKQMKRITNFMISCSKEAGEIKHILETGEVPEESEDESMEMMRRMIAELQARVEAAEAGEDGI